jgi:hypothetical protein
MKRLMQLDRAWMTLWIIGSMSGWVIGFAVTFLVGLLSNSKAFGQPYLPFLIFGICVGLLQWRVALKGIVNGVAWVFATGLASVLIVASYGFAASQQLIPSIMHYYNPGCLSASCDSYALDDTWLGGVVVVSLIGGLSAALPTGLVLSRYGFNIYLWVFGSLLASLVGVLLYIPFAVGPGYVGSLSYLAVIGPLVIAVISAPFLYATPHEPIRLQR